MLRYARDIRNLILAALLATLLASCLGDGDTGELFETPVPGEAIVVPTASPTPTVAPTPTASEWVAALLEPGPTATAPTSIFFLNGPDVWIMNGDLSVARVTQERRVSVVATAPDGSHAAAVFLTTDGGREAEEIRIVQSEGEESEPIYGPEIVGNPGGNPRVLSLVWSPDGSQVAVIRSDGSIWLAGPEREPEALLEGGDGAVEKLVWAPSGTGFALLTRQPSGAGVVDVVALDGGETVSIAPDASFGDVAWLPGQALLVATEDRRGGATPAAGSLFTFRPDGAERELLLSAGEFGPVVEITQLTPSPDGQLLAFVVKVPNPEGLLQFHALYVREIESGVLRELAVAAGQGVNDLWWLEGGRLAWRATPAQPDNVYDGAEPFIIEVGILETGETQFVYTTE